MRLLTTVLWLVVKGWRWDGNPDGHALGDVGEEDRGPLELQECPQVLKEGH